MLRKIITVKGKVQGVFFRATTLQKALELGISGNVRNLPNGSVSIDAEAENSQLLEFTAWCWTGSPRSKVENVEIIEMDPIGYTNFSIV